MNEDIGRGPLNIIVKGLDLQTIHSLSIYNNILTINNIQFLIHEVLRYCSEVSLDAMDTSKFTDNLAFLQTSLTKPCSPKLFFYSSRLPTRGKPFIHGVSGSDIPKTWCYRKFLQTVSPYCIVI